MTQTKTVRTKKPTRIYLIMGGALIVMALLAWGFNRLFPKPLVLPPGQKLKAAWSVGKSAPFYVGDLVPVTLTIAAADGIVYQLPDLGGSLGRLELKERSRIVTERRRGGSVQKVLLWVVGWEPGKHAVTALTLNYRDSAGRRGVYRIPAYSIRILSALPKGKSKAELLALDVKGTKKPLGYPADLIWLGWALAAALLITGGYFLGRKLFNRTGHSPEGIAEPDAGSIEPADVIANRRLAALEQTGYLEAGDFKRYYAELSECAREYLENRFRIRALEMTTEEFLILAASASQLRPEHQAMLTAFLQAADLVKFAKFIPARGEAEQDLDLIRRLVEATRDVAAEAPDSSVAASRPNPSR
jgi:hypothetical protein